jgi:hypothetical protein
MLNTDLNYTTFQKSVKPSIHLKPIFGSMLALSSSLPNDYNVETPVLVPKEKKMNQVNSVLENSSSAKLPFLTNIYIGSLTIVGLFIIFRFVQKHP